MRSSPTPELSNFAADVLAGLSSSPKSLTSKYFYDDRGSLLFQEIMKLPEYYLTNCEIEIFTDQSNGIYDEFVDGGYPIDLIELGAGDGTKTEILIESFLQKKQDITYSPIDISREAIGAITTRFRSRFPQLAMHPRVGDYFSILESLRDSGGRRKVVLFLGSNIGNFSRDESIRFVRDLNRVLNRNDLLFIGFDLQKDPNAIVSAYAAPAGITAEFNLNLLARINRELGGKFDTDHFAHYANYHPIEGSARSYLISLEKQTVEIAALGRAFEFEQWEAVFMEISQKYNLRMIDDLATESGFAVKRNFFDSRNYYCDSLWQMR
ncbi:MAG: L-histidine N(alpha)-methyltransferase [Chloracidobacterium sp.]|nr:L-histidine N(alpha)-methyltransferase [Chloracidobacterium sp.]